MKISTVISVWVIGIAMVFTLQKFGFAQLQAQPSQSSSTAISATMSVGTAVNGEVTVTTNQTISCQQLYNGLNQYESQDNYIQNQETILNEEINAAGC